MAQTNRSQTVFLIVIIVAIAVIIFFIFKPRETFNEGQGTSITTEPVALTIQVSLGISTGGSYVDLENRTVVDGTDVNADAIDTYDIAFKHIRAPEITEESNDVIIEEDRKYIERVSALGIYDAETESSVNCKKVKYDDSLKTITLIDLKGMIDFEPKTIICVKTRNGKHATLTFDEQYDEFRLELK